MPGFSINSGGDNKYAMSEPKRKHRWKMSIDGVKERCDIYLQKASRPKYTQEKVEMWANQAPAYFSGRTTWNPMSLAFYDVENPDVAKYLYGWHKTVVTHSEANTAISGPVGGSDGYKGNATLDMLGPGGGPIETWELFGCWPLSIDYGEVTYTTSEIALVNVEMIYDMAMLQE